MALHLFSLPLFLLCSLFSLTAFANLSPSLHYHACHQHESRILLQFKQSFVISEHASSDPLSHPKTTSWIPTTDCCSWHGIQCDELTGHVIAVDLRSSQLYGSLDANSSLFSLVHLQYLDLSDNDFNHSRIPSRICEFSQLRYLNLAQYSENTFFGEVPPQVSHLRNLLILDLRSYRLRVIPPNPINKLQLKKSTLRSLIQNATSLEALGLDFVTISSSIPDMLTNLTSLRKLSLFQCELYGEFQIEKFFKLKMLNVLGLSGNKLSLLPGISSSNETLPPIQQLGLRSCNLHGEIPSWIMNLTNLSYLDLEDNNLQGQIPHSFFRLVNLKTLSLGSNSFQGQIELDMFLKLRRLIRLDLSFNKLTLLNKKGSYSNVTMPPLEFLYLSSCNISGEFPSWIMNLTSSLSLLVLEDNNLRGEIPHSLFTLENLEALSLEYNLLEGQLDLEMFLKLKMLTDLGLSYNKLSLLTEKDSTNVTLPPLQDLSLASCNLVEFPPFIRELDQLESLNVENNDLKTIPSWMWRKKNLLVLFSSGNSLTGRISPLMCNLKSLVVLEFAYNNLSGVIPSCLGSFSQSLQALMLQGNKLVGHIPQAYAPGSNLMMIDFSNNTLKGKLPRALVNCKRLEFLDVSHNGINDSFPYWLSTLPELKVVLLRSNEFHGAIMCPSRCTFPKLHIIDLSHNEFSGNLAPEIFKNLKSMTASKISQLQYENNTVSFSDHRYDDIFYSFTMSNKGVVMDYQELQQDFYSLLAIDLSSNKLVGEIPNVLGDLNRLLLLNLSNNMLSGNVPLSFGKLSNLEALDLSCNDLSGQIPPQLTELTFLEFFNVSFNNLSGPIPDSKQFNTFENNSFMGNQGLCGRQVSKECEDQAKPPPPTSDGDEDSESEHFFNWKIVLIGYGGGVVAGIALGSAFSHDIFMLLKRVF